MPSESSGWQDLDRRLKMRKTSVCTQMNWVAVYTHQWLSTQVLPALGVSTESSQ